MRGKLGELHRNRSRVHGRQEWSRARVRKSEDGGRRTEVGGRRERRLGWLDGSMAEWRW